VQAMLPLMPWATRHAGRYSKNYATGLWRWWILPMADTLKGSVNDISNNTNFWKSQHLKVLKDAKLISLRTEGNKNIYELNREGILAMRDYLDKFWSEALLNFKAIAEQTEKEKNDNLI
jgi:hypothetical protein